MKTPFTDIAQECRRILELHDRGAEELAAARAGLNPEDRDPSREMQEDHKIAGNLERQLQRTILDGLPEAGS